MTHIAEPSRTGRSFLAGGVQQQDAAAEELQQWLARLTGFLFLVTFATSIPAFFIFYAPIKDPSFILGGAFSLTVAGGAVLELILIAANVGTALAIYPVLKGTFPGLSLAFVAARILESTFIAIGIVAVMARNTSACRANKERFTLNWNDGAKNASTARQELLFELSKGVARDCHRAKLTIKAGA